MSSPPNNANQPTSGIGNLDGSALHGWAAVRDLLVLSAPMIVMMISRMAMGFIDFLMVKELGTTAQAAISPAMLLTFALTSFGMGISMAIQTYVSQAIGRNQPEVAGAYCWQALYLAGAFGVLSFPAVWLMDYWFLPLAELGKHSPEMIALEKEYLSWALYIVAPAVLTAGLQGFLNGAKRPTLTLPAVFVSTAVNAFGNWALIFGNLGFPEMGMAGAGLATVIGWWVRVLMLAAAALMPSVDATYHTRILPRLDMPKMRGLVRVGIPQSFQWLVDIGAGFVFISLVIPPLGEVATAASNAVLQCIHFAFMPAVGLGMALTTQVGQAIGAGDLKLARDRVNLALRVTTVYMVAAGVSMLLFGAHVMGVLANDPEVIAVGAGLLIWAAIFQVPDALLIISMAALRGAGDTRWPAIAMGISSWVFQAGAAILLVRLGGEIWGAHGGWAGFTLHIFVAGGLLYWRWRSGAWESIKLFADEPAATSAGSSASGTNAEQSAPDDVTADCGVLVASEIDDCDAFFDDHLEDGSRAPAGDDPDRKRGTDGTEQGASPVIRHDADPPRS